jgi:hypothetical protein
MKTSQDDGCAVVTCDKHGFIARVIIGAETLCQKCGRWIKSAPEVERRKREIRRARNQRFRVRKQSPTIQSGELSLATVK